MFATVVAREGRSCRQTTWPWTGRAYGGRTCTDRFLKAAATRYRDARPIWEIWNEPNRANFWEPRANPAEYMAVARATAEAIRRAVPDAAIIGPALGHIVGEEVLDVAFLQAWLDDGITGLVDAISIHPFVDPEVVAPDYDRVRTLVVVAAGGQTVPVVSTEWGFATKAFVSDDLQADVLVRMFLINLSLGVPLSIAYVAVDRTEAYVPEEKRTYGIARADHSPKAAYHALRDMNERLRGMRFSQTLPLQNCKSSVRSAQGLTFYPFGDGGAILARHDQRGHHARPDHPP